jgi:hypothetical protein
MGLDMYLAASKHIAKVDWNILQNKPDLSYDSAEAILPLWNEVVTTAGMKDVATDIYGVEVKVTAAYWRKCNQIHAWFVENVQRGEDNCGEYYVSKDKLKELSDLVNEALAKRDPSLLPPQEGFFFGNTDINEYYWEQLKYTKKQLERIFALPDFENLSFSYCSSW